MGLKDVTGVFSKYFIVGFFVPAFFTLAALKLVLAKEFVPHAVRPDTAGSFAVLGAVALLFGLLTLGLDYPLTRIYEGYPLQQPYRGRSYDALRWLGRKLTERQRRRRNRLRSLLGDESTSAAAGWLLERRFPYTDESLMPTRIGNVIRAFEEYAGTRWGLNAVVLWPHVASLLPDNERQLHEDGRADFAFFRNASLGALLAGWMMVVDAVWRHPHPHWLDWIYVLPFPLAYGFVIGAAGAAERWGLQVRASLDVHRFDVYDALGLKRPRTLFEERALNSALLQFLLWSEPPLPDALRAPPGGQPRSTPPEAPAC